MAPAESMQLGMVGLGRMGGNIVRRLMRAGHECVVFDRTPAVTKALADEGAIGASLNRGFRVEAAGAKGGVGNGPGR